ncbi:MAG: hypothetical protein U0790_27650 [Isosphaeraceae bacterium]
MTLNLENLTLAGGRVFGADGGSTGGDFRGGGGAARRPGRGDLRSRRDGEPDGLHADRQPRRAAPGAAAGPPGGGRRGRASSIFPGGNGSVSLSGGGGGGGMGGPGGDGSGNTGGLGGADSAGAQRRRRPRGPPAAEAEGLSAVFVAYSGGPAIGANPWGFGGGGGGGQHPGHLRRRQQRRAGGFAAGGGGSGLTGRGGQGGFGGGGGGAEAGASPAGDGSHLDGAPGRPDHGRRRRRRDGGAIFLKGGTVSLTNCTIIGNQAVGGAGGAATNPGGAGSGIGVRHRRTRRHGEPVELHHLRQHGRSQSDRHLQHIGHPRLGLPGEHGRRRRGGGAAPTSPPSDSSARIAPRLSGFGNFLGRPGRFPRRGVAGVGDPRSARRPTTAARPRPCSPCPAAP